MDAGTAKRECSAKSMPTPFRLRIILGNTYQQLKEYAKACDIREWTLERRKRVLGEEHADTLQTAHKLGNTEVDPIVWTKNRRSLDGEAG